MSRRIFEPPGGTAGRDEDPSPTYSLRLPLTPIRPPAYPYLNGCCLHLGSEHSGWFHLQREEFCCRWGRYECACVAATPSKHRRAERNAQPPDGGMREN